MLMAWEYTLIQGLGSLPESSGEVNYQINATFAGALLGESIRLADRLQVGMLIDEVATGRQRFAVRL